MSYNPEHLYEIDAKQEYIATEAEKKAAKLKWLDLCDTKKVHEFFRKREPLEFAEFVIREIANTQFEIDDWRHPCSQGTKAACFDKIKAALQFEIDSSVVGAVDDGNADEKREYFND